MHSRPVTLDRQQLDQPLDLPPAAIMDDVAKVAAAVRARRRFIRREAAELRDEVGRVGDGGGIGKVDVQVQLASPCVGRVG